MPKARKYTKEILQEIESRLANGISQKEIAIGLGIPYGSMGELTKRFRKAKVKESKIKSLPMPEPVSRAPVSTVPATLVYVPADKLSAVLKALQ